MYKLLVMKQILLLEELAQCIAGIFLLTLQPIHLPAWLWFILFFSPDIAMLGYLINTSIGAYCYNLFHHKAVAIVLACIGFYTHNEWLTLVGILLFAHASFDRVFGYGLKYTDSFKNTHLGKLK